jgi:hypothetical protein
MAAPSSIGNLQEVQAWLGTVSVGDEVAVGSSGFTAPMVLKVFALLPGSDPIPLTVTATVLGEANTTCLFVFTQPASDLLLTLTLSLPPAVQWTLIPQLSVVFGTLVATLTPSSQIPVVGMTFSAVLQTTTSSVLSMPISLSVPTFDGDWLLATSNVPIGALTAAGLDALAGGVDVLAMLPLELADLNKLSITEFQLAFNFSTGSCSFIRLGMQYAGNWEFFDKKFIVQSVNFDVEVTNPFSTPTSYDAKLYAQMQIPPLPAFDVGGQFPDNAVFVQLAPDQTLMLTDVFSFLQLPVPSGMPSVAISTLGFTLYTSSGAFQFNIAITLPIQICGNFSLDTFLFNMGATYDVAKGFQGFGSLYSHFTIGSTQLMISGAYSQGGGLSLVGEAFNIPIGELITELGTAFGVPATDIPQPIRDLVLTSIRAALDTGAQTFDFTCTGTTTICGVTAQFIPTIHLNYASGAFAATFSGTLILQQTLNDGSKRNLKFNVTYSTSAAANWISATFVSDGEPISFQDLASIFNVTLPTIPTSLDLGLEELGFRYDFTATALTFGLKSTTYGNAVFEMLPIAKVTQSFFLLNSNQTFSLSNLPLVGQELAQIQNVSITDLLVVISSMATVDAATAKLINDQIDIFLSAAYPRVPKAGLTGMFLLSASMLFGSEVLPLSVSLGGGTSGSLEAPDAQPMLPAPPGSAIVRQGDVIAASGNDGGTTWFSVQKSFGPVTIQRLGVLYQSKTQTLWFELDASLMAGPLTLSLVGLGIGSPLSSFAPQFNLQGLGVAYSAPPLKIAGALINLAPPGADYVEFEGGVMISTATLTVQAFGYYGAKDGFTSMFLFGDLLYPFGGPPAFFVTGTALGFGYNSNLNIPDIAQVQVFPFVQVLSNPDFFGPNPTPADVLGSMLDANPKVPGSPWVERQEGTLWFAAGITFTSFSLVNSVAMVFVEIGPNLVIALIGVATAQFPQKIPGLTKQPVYAYIELDLEVRFAPNEGVFSLEAVLAASSFLLDRACVLTGGFAFYVWFGPSPHSGDFVVSLGGYHPGFQPPKYYPTVPRVGFHWSLDSSITISGGTYFAFTPAVMMVGGALNATYQAGNLKAWFNAHADVIVRWKPFWFDASIGITIGASYTIDLLFTSTTLSIELGVDLELWGPPTGGTVHVDWFVISFTIPFGASISAGAPVGGWDEGVQTMLPNTGTTETPNVLSVSPTSGLTPTGTSPSSSSSSGGLAANPGDDNVPWLVRGGQFGFTVDAPIPATTITIGGTYTFKGQTFDVYPLRWIAISATQAITITDADGTDWSGSFDANQTVKSVPQALWGAPPQTPSGKPQVPSGADLLVPGQSTGVALLVKVPTLGDSPGNILLSNVPGDNLTLPNAVVPLSASAQPQGDIPVLSDDTVAIIANPDTGIGSPPANDAREEILAALTALGFAPKTSNDPMTKFAAQAGCAFSNEPLLVQVSGAAASQLPAPRRTA